MKVYVNDKDVDLLPGSNVKHAVTAAGLLGELVQGNRVYDEWGNEVGLEGAVQDGVRLYVRKPAPKA